MRFLKRKMRKLLILFVLAGFTFVALFFGGCITTYNPSPEQLKENRKAYEQYERDKVQRDILEELKRRK